MKKSTLTLLAVAILLIGASLLAASASDSAADHVVFIADGGTGDGSSPDKPLGNASGYSTFTSTAYQYSSLNQAINKLKQTGGTVVVCGPVTLKWGKLQGTGASELPIGPGTGSMSKTVTFTSLYNGIDYRTTKNAALIVERDSNNRLSPEMKCPSVWENITLRVNHKTASCVTAVNYSLSCNAYRTEFKTTFDTEAYLNGVSLDYRVTDNAYYFPLLTGGHRYKSVTGNPSLTVNGGKWQYVCGGCVGFAYGENDNKYGILTGSTTVVFGGYARTIEGIGGGSYKNGGRITGNTSLTITGGTVYGDISIGGIGGFDGTESIASLTINGGNFDNTTAINDVSGSAGWHSPKSATVDCTGLKGNAEQSAMERAEALCRKITYVDSITMPDGSVRTFFVENEPLPEAVIERLRSTPYTRKQYKDVYDSILAGENQHNVLELMNMLSAKPTNSVAGFDVPANTDVMREKTIDYFDAMSRIEWTPKTDMDYTTATAFTTKLVYKAGQIYTGMPYSSTRKPSASILEFMPYLTENGVYTGTTEYNYLIGVDCGAPRLAWAYGGALCNSGIYARDFQMMINYNEATNRIIGTVGNYDTSGYTGYTDIRDKASFNAICEKNGPEVMYEAYAQVRPCDYVCSRFFIGTKTTTDQHIRMAVADAAVYRTGSGAISGSKSYLTLSEQTSTIYDVDGKKTTWQLNKKFTFDALYHGGYIPLTLKSLQADTVEAPTLTFDDKGRSGIDLVGRGTVTSNYTLFALNATVTNASGKVVKQAAAYPYTLSYTLTDPSALTNTPSGGSPDTSRDQGMSTLNAAVRALPSGTYTYELTATIGFGTKTVCSFTFEK